jgi:dipeptidyl aminopeptidase/acylaminoacyl peptidase
VGFALPPDHPATLYCAANIGETCRSEMGDIRDRARLEAVVQSLRPQIVIHMAAQALVRRGVADPDRLGVMGASYGGFMTSWIITQTNRFKAASTGASLNDLTDVYYASDAGDFMIEYFKRPWENREGYATHSALTFADRVTTPLLIQHGENDRRVPIAGAWKFYRALKAMGKTVEFDIYPRGGHVMFEPLEEREMMRRNLEWFGRWIKPNAE